VIKIAHLSDLHLGPDVVARALLARRAWNRPVRPELLIGLQTKLRQESVDYVVISGDFVNKPKTSCFEEASKLVRNFLANAGIDINEKLLVVPGNHDVGFFPRAEKDDFRRLKKYFKFLQALFQEDELLSRKHRFFRVDEDKKVLFLGLDTTMKSLPPTADGQVGTSQINWARKKLQGYRNQLDLRDSSLDEFIKIAILHHHCVSIPGLSVRGERFMQLLDEGDVLKFFDEHGFNIVLHGHKHVPHVLTRDRSDTTTMMVVGAGTATSPYPDQQTIFGNTFNIIEVNPQRLQGAVQRYKANGLGEFQLDWRGPAIHFGRKYGQGYSTEFVRKVLHIQADGTLNVEITRRGFHLDSDRTVASMPVKITTSTPLAKISSVCLTHPLQGVQLKWQAQTDQLYDGEVLFAPPLDEQNGPAMEISYKYQLIGGVVMSLAEWEQRQMGASQAPEESTSTTLVSPIRRLAYDIIFPQGYDFKKFTRSVEFIQNGVMVPNKNFQFALKDDPPLNRVSFMMDNPPQGHMVKLRWNLLDKWP